MWVLALITLQMMGSAQGDCAMHNHCNGHGSCVASTSTCACYEGFGAASDITLYRAPDCSLRTCPSGKAWSDVPTAPSSAHALAECSNRGTCDKQSGQCKCYAGFSGDSCQRTTCPNNCSGHGQCVSIKQMARMPNALPLAPNTYYEGDEDGETWDEDKLYGCVCDSSWEVGLGSAQRQEPEWFGPDCSLRHCPSADDPRTIIDETDCQEVGPPDSYYVGLAGNLCQVDCANRGICDHSTGLCQCFNGQYGEDCSINDPDAVYEYWNKAVDYMKYVEDN